MPIVRSLFRAMLPSWAEAGLSASGMIREATLLGIGTYRRQDMLADIREFQGFFRRESMVTAWDVNTLPHHGLMTEIDLQKDRKYRVFADVTTQHKITGEVQTTTVSFYANELKTFTDWESDYQDAVSENNYQPEREILYMQTRAIEHNAGWTY